MSSCGLAQALLRKICMASIIGCCSGGRVVAHIVSSCAHVSVALFKFFNGKWAADKDLENKIEFSNTHFTSFSHVGTGAGHRK